MNEPSPKRRRTLALQERAIKFSVNVNTCCPEYFSNLPSKTVWGQLVRAADSASNNLVNLVARTRIGGDATGGNLLDDYPKHASAIGERSGSPEGNEEAFRFLNWNSKLNCN